MNLRDDQTVIFEQIVLANPIINIGKYAEKYWDITPSMIPTIFYLRKDKSFINWLNGHIGHFYLFVSPSKRLISSVDS